MAINIQRWIAIQTEWLDSINPELRLYKSDIGAKYAIIQKTPAGTINLLSDFMSCQEWYIFRTAINVCGEAAFKAGIEKRMVTK